MPAIAGRAVKRRHVLAPMIVAVLVIGLAACGGPKTVDLPGTIWRVTAVEGANEESTGQTLEFPDAHEAHLTQPCGEFRAVMHYSRGNETVAFEVFREVWGVTACPLGAFDRQAPLLDALGQVSSWRAVSADVLELTGGPVIRLERLPTSEMHRIGVEVIGAANGWPAQRLVLRIGQQSWALEAGDGGGVAWPFINRPLRVEIVTAADCTTLASVWAPLDTYWAIRFTSETGASITDVTDGAFETGPALGEISFGPCP